MKFSASLTSVATKRMLSYGLLGSRQARSELSSLYTTSSLLLSQPFHFLLSNMFGFIILLQRSSIAVFAYLIACFLVLKIPRPYVALSSSPQLEATPTWKVRLYSISGNTAEVDFPSGADPDDFFPFGLGLAFTFVLVLTFVFFGSAFLSSTVFFLVFFDGGAPRFPEDLRFRFSAAPGDVAFVRGMSEEDSLSGKSAENEPPGSQSL
mmetsp:Transcript_14381/g.35066  ORF Transcript_14381/g.35066 Transcript_14381/m.35066 type:complete len:208 (-) Transcript_14381:165-788(-)